MSNKPLKISEQAAVQMPMKTVASLIDLVAAGVFAYTELTARLVSLETSRELFENDLLKKSSWFCHYLGDSHSLIFFAFSFLINCSLLYLSIASNSAVIFASNSLSAFSLSFIRLTYVL